MVNDSIFRNMWSGHENCRINKYIEGASCWSIYIIAYDAQYTQRQNELTIVILMLRIIMA